MGGDEDGEREAGERNGGAGGAEGGKRPKGVGGKGALTCMYLALLTAAWHSFLLRSKALCKPWMVSNSPCLLLSGPCPGPSCTCAPGCCQ